MKDTAELFLVPISAKTGEGVTELLDMMLLVAEVGELKGDLEKNAEGIVIEANLDSNTGISGTLIIFKDGVMKTGMTIVSGCGIASTRLIENFMGAGKITEARFSSPIGAIGWSELPKVGLLYSNLLTQRKEAENYVAKFREKTPAKKLWRKRRPENIIH